MESLNPKTWYLHWKINHQWFLRYYIQFFRLGCKLPETFYCSDCQKKSHRCKMLDLFLCGQQGKWSVRCVQAKSRTSKASKQSHSSNGRAESWDWQFSSICISEGSSEYVWRSHSYQVIWQPCACKPLSSSPPTHILCQQPWLCWPSSSTSLPPKCRGIAAITHHRDTMY